jgi:ankyrin repeat protein
MDALRDAVLKEDIDEAINIIKTYKIDPRTDIDEDVEKFSIFEAILMHTSNITVNDIQTLISECENINFINQNNDTLLHIYCNNAYPQIEPDILILFINSGINISSVNNKNRTCLFYVGAYDIEGVKLLLEHGIDTTIKNANGQTAYDHLNEPHYTEIDELIREYKPHYKEITELIREYEEISLIKGTS